MNKKKNMTAKIVAVFALASIIIWVIWTGMLVLFWGNDSSQREYSAEEIQELIDSMSGSTTVTATWSQEDTTELQ